MTALHWLTFRGCLQILAGQVVVAGGILAVLAGAAGAKTPGDIAFERIASEIGEHKRLVFHLKQDEQKARKELTNVEQYRTDALHFANGGRNLAYRTGFVTLLRKFELSPGQTSLFQAPVPALEAGDFVPEPEELFEGGDVSQLVQYCRTNNLSLRIGSRAQLVVAELVRDLAGQADLKIAALDERIEHDKAQNIAHTDLIGKLMICATHCHGCHACCHYGYGYCGYAPVLPDHPIAGLNSDAYDTQETPRYLKRKSSEHMATDRDRLKFLTPGEPASIRRPTKGFGKTGIEARTVGRTNRAME